MKQENLLEFEKVMEKFNELIFEIQIQDNKKILEFQKKLKELKIKIELELKGYEKLNEVNEDLIKGYEKLNEVNENLIKGCEKLNEINEKIIEEKDEIIKLYKCDN